MTTPGQTIATMPARDVTFANHEIAFGKTFDVIANAINHADELVADSHRDGDRFLSPGVPVIYMYVGPADGGFQDPNEDVLAGNVWNRDFLEPQSGLGFRLYHCLHRFLHDPKLNQSGNQESRNSEPE